MRKKSSTPKLSNEPEVPTETEQQPIQEVEQVQPVEPVSAAQDEKSFKVADMAQTNIESLAAKLDDFKTAPVIPPIEEVKRKRGRKPGSKNEPKVPIEEFKPKQEQPVFAGAVISGLVLMTIVDAFVPFIITIIHNAVNKKTKMNVRDLQLPHEIRKEMGVVADEAIKSSNIKISPTQALFFTLISAYGTAYMAATLKAKPVEQKTSMVVNR